MIFWTHMSKGEGRASIKNFILKLGLLRRVILRQISWGVQYQETGKTLKSIVYRWKYIENNVRANKLFFPFSEKYINLFCFFIIKKHYGAYSICRWSCTFLKVTFSTQFFSRLLSYKHGVQISWHLPCWSRPKQNFRNPCWWTVCLKTPSL